VSYSAGVGCFISNVLVAALTMLSVCAL